MQPLTPEDPQSQTRFIPPGNDVAGHYPTIDPTVAATTNNQANHQMLFYTTDQEDDLNLNLPPVDDQEDQIGGQSSPFVLPFQNSGAMPTITQMGAAGTKKMTGAIPGVPPSPPVAAKTRHVPLQVVKYLLIVSVVLITLVGASLFVLAQSSAPSTTQGQGVQNTNTNEAGTSQPATSVHTTQQAGAPKATKAPSKLVSQPQGNQTQGQGTSALSSNAIPSAQQLSQLGWTQAGLSFGDAIEALRTGATFTDREMSYDYRNIGTPTKHSGTLTASTFLLTPGGQVRFTHNDVRAINDVLYNKIRNGKIIQQVVNAQPSLVQFQIVQVQGQQRTFAWISVSFERLQSKIDPTSGKRTEGLELDAVSGQPLVHHMAVVLVRIPLQNQGANAPMGGTGWLVNTYALDANAQPAIATSPSV